MIYGEAVTTTRIVSASPGAVPPDDVVRTLGGDLVLTLSGGVVLVRETPSTTAQALSVSLSSTTALDGLVVTST